MNKTELVKAIAEKSDLSHNQVNASLNAMMEVILECVVADEPVRIPGFGTFRCKYTPERTVRNPATQEKIVCPANKKLVFTAGSKAKAL